MGFDAKQHGGYAPTTATTNAIKSAFTTTTSLPTAPTATTYHSFTRDCVSDRPLSAINGTPVRFFLFFFLLLFCILDSTIKFINGSAILKR